ACVDQQMGDADEEGNQRGEDQRHEQCIDGGVNIAGWMAQIHLMDDHPFGLEEPVGGQMRHKGPDEQIRRRLEYGKSHACILLLLWRYSLFAAPSIRSCSHRMVMPWSPLSVPPVSGRPYEAWKRSRFH